MGALAWLMNLGFAGGAADLTVDHLEIGFETHLRSLADVTAIVGSSPSRIFPQHAPQVFNSWELQVPYVVFGTRVSERVPTLAGTNTLVNKRLQVNSFAGTYKEAKALSDAIRLGTDTFRDGTMGNVTILHAWLTNENDVVEQSAGLDGRRRNMVSTTYQIWHIEQDPGLSDVTSGVGSADTIEKGVYDVLRLNSRVDEIVDGRIYPETAPQNKPSGPYIVYDKPDGDRSQTLEQGSHGILESTISLELWSPTYKQTHDLAEMCRRALDGYTGLMGALTVLICSLSDEVDEIAGSAGIDSRKSFSMTQEYEIIHAETAPSL